MKDLHRHAAIPSFDSAEAAGRVGQTTRCHAAITSYNSAEAAENAELMVLGVLSEPRAVALSGLRAAARGLATCLMVAVAAGCGRNTSHSQTAAAPEAVQLGPESVAVAKTETIQTGPIISGQLVAENEAAVRAKIGGSVVSVPVEEGQRVRKGQVLVRIEARDLRDANASAQAGVRSAENALQLARSELQRTEMLVKGGALAERDLDNARNAVTGAESQLAAARARLSSSQQQLADTTLESPISGVVSQKTVNAGDVVQPGTALVTVIDPSSMRLDASVPSDRIGDIRIGAPVQFTVRGYPGQTFTGHIDRISPAADPATRQVPIYVSIPNARGKLIAGLFADGRVSTESRRALVVPSSAIDATGATPTVTRVRGGKTERVDVKLGIHDPETERVEVVSGLNEGDIVLTGSSRGMTPGTPVQVASKAS